MRFLVDANLSPVISAALAHSGHHATHVAAEGLLTASDDDIAAAALRMGAVIVSADSDFATMLALTGAAAPSLVLLRSADRLPPREQADLLTDNLPTFVDHLAAGCVVSLSPTHLRVRALPI